jgi:hypothetical protein
MLFLFQVSLEMGTVPMSQRAPGLESELIGLHPSDARKKSEEL